MLNNKKIDSIKALYKESILVLDQQVYQMTVNALDQAKLANAQQSIIERAENVGKTFENLLDYILRHEIKKDLLVRPYYEPQIAKWNVDEHLKDVQSLLSDIRGLN